MNATSAGGLPRLHLVTDDAVLSRARFREVASALLERGGSSVALHVRGPTTPGGPLLELVRTLRGGARASGALLVVNDRVDVALAAQADGAHLGARSLPPGDARRLLGAGRLLGVSVHTVEEGVEAATAGADWIFAGTIYATRSHPGRPPRGPSFVAEVAAGAGGVPVLAIGGVTPECVGEVLAAGAAGVAVIRGIWDPPDPLGELLRYLEALDERDCNPGRKP